jgi:hypothetical protein
VEVAAPRGDLEAQVIGCFESEVAQRRARNIKTEGLEPE